MSRALKILTSLTPPPGNVLLVSNESLEFSYYKKNCFQLRILLSHEQKPFCLTTNEVNEFSPMTSQSWRECRLNRLRKGAR